MVCWELVGAEVRGARKGPILLHILALGGEVCMFFWAAHGRALITRSSQPLFYLILGEGG